MQNTVGKHAKTVVTVSGSKNKIKNNENGQKRAYKLENGVKNAKTVVKRIQG